MVHHHAGGSEGGRQDAGAAVSDGLVPRDFSAPAPDVLRLTDFTEHPKLTGKPYLASLKDVLSNRMSATR